MDSSKPNIPVACCLSDAQLREREATLLAEFESAVIAREELPAGYLFHLPGQDTCLLLIANLLAAERQCCPFLSFALHASPNHGPLALSITGPDGTKEFLRSLFF
jgi:hypothetical protein